MYQKFPGDDGEKVPCLCTVLTFTELKAQASPSLPQAETSLLFVHHLTVTAKHSSPLEA